MKTTGGNARQKIIPRNERQREQLGVMNGRKGIIGPTPTNVKAAVLPS